MEEQTTEVIEEIDDEKEVQADSLDDLIDNISGEIVEEDQPIEEVEEEPEKEEITEEKPELHKVKIDGEEQEVDYSELVKGYQTSKHNTQTAQQLADNQRQMAPVIGLAKRLQEDKEFAAHVFGYGKEPETELDPVEQIKADAVKEALAKVDERIQGQTDQAKQVEISTLKGKVQADPLYKDVQAKLDAYVLSQPKALQQNTWETLHTNPQAYTEMYLKFRKELEPEKPQVDKIVPPVLVASGQSGDVPLKTQNKQKLDKKKAEILKSGNADALEEYFMMDGGLIDSLGI